MNSLREAFLVVVAIVSISGACRAQTPSLLWSEWETSAVPKHGPEEAAGAILYFPYDAAKDPMPRIFSEMAKVAKWDILRINRDRLFDRESSDGDILQSTADRIAEVRKEGYRKVVVAGVSRGGWLALLAASLPGVDAAIALAPGMNLERSGLIRTRDVLAESLAHAAAERIAIFFFEGDPLERLDERRSIAIQRGLQKSNATYMIVDHPPDLEGHWAALSGRLVRRYRDCLLQLVSDDSLPAGEFECSRSSGYAVGSDIGFPVAVGLSQPPSDANPALLPYLGRWEGDDEWGSYLIVETIAIERDRIVFGMGWSEAVGSGQPTWVARISFQLDPNDGSIVEEPHGPQQTTIRPKTPTELEWTVGKLDQNGNVTKRQILLHKRTSEAAAR